MVVRPIKQEQMPRFEDPEDRDLFDIFRSDSDEDDEFLGGSDSNVWERDWPELPDDDERERRMAEIVESGGLRGDERDENIGEYLWLLYGDYDPEYWEDVDDFGTDEVAV